MSPMRLTPNKAANATCVRLSRLRRPRTSLGSMLGRYRGDTLAVKCPGRPILVGVTLNGRTSARLILDTGADKTLIKPRLLVAAGIDLTQPVGFGEFSGVVAGKTTTAPYFTVNSVQVGQFSSGRRGASPAITGCSLRHRYERFRRRPRTRLSRPLYRVNRSSIGGRPARTARTEREVSTPDAASSYDRPAAWRATAQPSMGPRMQAPPPLGTAARV